MAKPAPKSAPKVSKKCLPVTDPARDDWSVLGKLVGRSVAPTGNEEADAKALKDLLFEAYGRNCDGLVTAACHSRSGGGTSYLQTIFKVLGNHPGRRQDFYDTVRTRLLLPEDGVDRPVVDEKRGSSYNMLAYWDPKAMGVLPYIKVRVGHIIASYAKESKARARMQSYDAMMTSGIDLVRDSDGTGRTIHQDNGGIDIDDRDAQEAYDAGADLTEPTAATPEDLAAASGAGSSLGTMGETQAGKPLPNDHAAVVAIEALLESIESENAANVSPLEREDFVEALAENGIDTDEYKTNRELMARNKEYEARWQTEIRAAIELRVVQRIMGSVGGAERFPAEINSRVSAAIDELNLDVDGDGEIEAIDLSSPRKSRKRSPVQHVAYALRQSRVFGHTKLDLLSPARSEYRLFEAVLGERIIPGESPESRFAQLKQLADRMMAEKCADINTPEEKAEGCDTIAEVQEWDPAKQSFGRAFPDVLDHLHQKISIELEQEAKRIEGDSMELLAGHFHGTENHEDKPAKGAKASQAKASPALPKEEVQTTLDFNLESLITPANVKAAGSVQKLVDQASAAAESQAIVERIEANHFRNNGTVECILNSSAFHRGIAATNALEGRFWNTTDIPSDELETADRIDYQFLCSKLGMKPDLSLEGPDLHETMRDLARKWVESMIADRDKRRPKQANLDLEENPNAKFLAEFDGRLRAFADGFDPSTSVFSVEVNTFLREELREDKKFKKAYGEPCAVSADKRLLSAATAVNTPAAGEEPDEEESASSVGSMDEV